MKFEELFQGDRFIFPDAETDGEDKTLGIDIYIKLECPVIPADCPNSNNINPRTAVCAKTGSLFSVKDDAEILKMH